MQIGLLKEKIQEEQQEDPGAKTGEEGEESNRYVVK